MKAETILEVLKGKQRQSRLLTLQVSLCLLCGSPFSGLSICTLQTLFLCHSEYYGNTADLQDITKSNLLQWLYFSLLGLWVGIIGFDYYPLPFIFLADFLN